MALKYQVTAATQQKKEKVNHTHTTNTCTKIL